MWTENGGRLPELAPLPGQADVALRLVQVRRRRTAAVAASMAAVLVLLSIVVQSRGSGRAIIEPVSPGVARTASGPPSHPALTGRDGALHAALTTPSPYAHLSMSPDVTVAAVPSPTTGAPSPSAVPTPPFGTATPAPQPRPAEPAWREQKAGVGKCVDTEAWCPVLNTFTTKGFVRLTTGVCRPVVHGGSVMTFPTDQEIDLVVARPDGRELWRWSRGQHFEPGEHTVEVAGGDCVTWTVGWDTVGDDGRAVPAGPYVVRAYLLSDAGLPPAERPIDVK